MKLYKKKELCIMTALILIALIICMQSPLNFLSSGNSSTDSSVFKYIGMAMKNGQIPYRDTFDHKGLLLYFINYLGALILENRGIWILEVLSMTLSVILAYKILRLFWGAMVSLLNVIISFSYLGQYFQGGNLSEEWALPFIFGGIYLFTQFLLYDKLKNWKIILCGVLCGAVLMLRMNMIAIWISYAIVIIFYLIIKKQYGQLVRYTSCFLLGNILILIPMLIYLVCNNALYDFYQQYIVFNFSYSNVTLFEKWKTFLFFTNQPIFYLIFALYLYTYFFQKKIFIKYKCIFISVGFSIVLNLIMISVSGREYGHYGIIIIPTVLIPMGYLIQLCMESMKREKNITSGAMIVLYYCLSVIIIPNYLLCINTIVDLKMNNYNIDLALMVDEIEARTNQDDLISVFGNENFLYCRTGRMSASKYSYQFPLIAVEESIFYEYLKDIKENQPKIIVISQMGGYNFEYYYEELLKQVINVNYISVFKNDEERMAIYQLNIKGRIEMKKVECK